MDLGKNYRNGTKKTQISNGVILIFLMVFSIILFFSVPYFKSQFELSSTMVIHKEIAEDLYPSVISDSRGNTHVAWQSDRNGNWDIYHTVLRAEGGEEEFISLTRNLDDDLFPSLLEDEHGYIWVVWARFGSDGTSICTQRPTTEVGGAGTDKL